MDGGEAPEGLKGQTKWFGIHWAPKPNWQRFMDLEYPRRVWPEWWWGFGSSQARYSEGPSRVPITGWQTALGPSLRATRASERNRDPGPDGTCLFTDAFAVPLTSRGTKSRVAADCTHMRQAWQDLAAQPRVTRWWCFKGLLSTSSRKEIMMKANEMQRCIFHSLVDWCDQYQWPLLIRVNQWNRWFLEPLAIKSITMCICQNDSQSRWKQ